MDYDRQSLCKLLCNCTVFPAKCALQVEDLINEVL